MIDLKQLMRLNGDMDISTDEGGWRISYSDTIPYNPSEFPTTVQLTELDGDGHLKLESNFTHTGVIVTAADASGKKLCVSLTREGLKVWAQMALAALEIEKTIEEEFEE